MSHSKKSGGNISKNKKNDPKKTSPNMYPPIALEVPLKHPLDVPPRIPEENPRINPVEVPVRPNEQKKPLNNKGA